MTWKAFFLTMLPGSLLVFMCGKVWGFLESGFTQLVREGLLPPPSFAAALRMVPLLLLTIVLLIGFWWLAWMVAILPISAIIQSEQDKS